LHYLGNIYRVYCYYGRRSVHRLYARTFYFVVKSRRWIKFVRVEGGAMENSSKEMCVNKSGGLDMWSYVQQNRGVQQQPLEMAIPLTVVNVLIFVSGLLGNTAVCIVIIKHRSLHTATNYYLFNLAISDLTLLIFGKLHN
jgi:hypothetical protein